MRHSFVQRSVFTFFIENQKWLKQSISTSQLWFFRACNSTTFRPQELLASADLFCASGDLLWMYCCFQKGYWHVALHCPWYSQLFCWTCAVICVKCNICSKPLRRLRSIQCKHDLTRFPCNGRWSPNRINMRLFRVLPKLEKLYQQMVPWCHCHPPKNGMLKACLKIGFAFICTKPVHNNFLRRLQIQRVPRWECKQIPSSTSTHAEDFTGITTASSPRSSQQDQTINWVQ